MKPMHIITEVNFKEGYIHIQPLPPEPKHDDHELIILLKTLIAAALVGIVGGTFAHFLYH